MIAGDEENHRREKNDEPSRGRSEAKQISFRVSENEYGKLQQSAETFQLSVPMFVKKKAQGAKLATPKFEKEAGVQIHRELRAIGNNVNQIARWCHKQKEETPQTEELQQWEQRLEQIQEELNRVWQQLS